MLPMRIRPGSLIVLEGLDSTGKSTVMDYWERGVIAPSHGTPTFDPAPLFTHQPSGASGLGPDVYELTERVDWSKTGSVYTRQFLHLAAHAEHYYHDIVPALQNGRPVIMDRCWWSTVAYGFRDEVRDAMSFRQWIKVCRLPTLGLAPDLVFLFTHQWGKEEGALDDDITLANYQRLAETYPSTTVLVPKGTPAETYVFIIRTLVARNFLGDVHIGDLEEMLGEAQ